MSSETDLPSWPTAWVATIALAWKAWPAGAVLRMVVTLVGSLATGAGLAFSLKEVVSGAGWPWFGALGLSLALPLVTGSIHSFFQDSMSMRVGQATDAALAAAALRPAGIEHLESSVYADRMELLRSNSNQVANLFDWMAAFAGSALALLTSLVLLLGVNPLLVLPVIIAAGIGVIQVRARIHQLAIYSGLIPGQRLARRVAELATSPEAAKDVRMLALGGWLVDRHRELQDRVRRGMIRGQAGILVGSAIGGALEAILLTGAVGMVIWLATLHRVGAPDVALAVVLLRSALSSAGSLGGMAGDLARNTHLARRYVWLRTYASTVAAPTAPVSPPTRLSEGIRLEEVCFRYPDADRDALHGLSMLLPAGSTVAIVGDNGAGKTSLMKLFARFYDPTAGRITIDGVDLRDLDPWAWRARLTGAFQDFVRFEVLAGHSVGIGRLESSDDFVAVENAARAGGAAAFLETLPEAYATQLGRQFPGGVDLSTGQWQKVAVSRALMRSDSLVTLLDEPTAALDARAEYELFEAYARQGREAKARGAITLLVSHRFSTVRMADLIVVLDAGRVVEMGTHGELMAAGGHYAEMYRLQAAAYTS